MRYERREAWRRRVDWEGQIEDSCKNSKEELTPNLKSALKSSLGKGDREREAWNIKIVWGIELICSCIEIPSM